MDYVATRVAHGGVKYDLYQNEEGEKYAVRQGTGDYLPVTRRTVKGHEYEIVQENDGSDHVFSAKDGSWWGPSHTMSVLFGIAQSVATPVPPAPSRTAGSASYYGGSSYQAAQPPSLAAALGVTSGSGMSAANTYGVAQGDAVKTTATSRYPNIGSFGAGPCVLFAIHNASGGVATVAHLDDVTDIKATFPQLLEQALSGYPSNTPLTVHFSSQTGRLYNRTWDALENLVAQHRNMTVETRDEAYGALVIGAQDGRVFLGSRSSDMQGSHMNARIRDRVTAATKYRGQTLPVSFYSVT